MSKEMKSPMDNWVLVSDLEWITITFFPGSDLAQSIRSKYAGKEIHHISCAGCFEVEA